MLLRADSPVLGALCCPVTAHRHSRAHAASQDGRAAMATIPLVSPLSQPPSPANVACFAPARELLPHRGAHQKVQFAVGAAISLVFLEFQFNFFFKIGGGRQCATCVEEPDGRTVVAGNNQLM